MYKKKHVIELMSGIILQANAQTYIKVIFMKFKDFDTELWEKVKEEANSKIKKETDFKIFGSEINQHALSIARKNISNAGLSKYIKVQLDNFFNAETPDKEGVIITNPPYDVRIRTKNINDFYKNIGNTLKQKYQK